MSDGSHTARKPWPWPGPAEGRPGPAFARTATRPTDSNVWVFRQHQVWVDYY